MTASNPASAGGAGARAWTWAGLLLTAAVLAALVADQVGLHTIAADLEEHYGPPGKPADPGIVFGYLYATGGICLLGWGAMVLAARSRAAWAPAAATAALVLGLGGGLFNLLVTEYGEPVLPPLWSGLTLLPCLAGAVAVVCFWKSRRSRA